MYAIISIQGKQLRATPDAVLEVPRLPGEVGQSLQIDKVLLVADGEKVSVGQPYLKGATVQAEIVAHYRGKKILIATYKKTKDSHRRRGYRSDLTSIKVSSIKA